MTQKKLNSKNTIIDKLKALYPELSLDGVKKAVDIFFSEMTTALICGDRVELRGFASWVVRKRKGKMARNPRNNDKIKVGDKGSLYFRASKELHKSLNEVN